MSTNVSEKISVLKGFKRLFSLKSLVEFAKGVAYMPTFSNVKNVAPSEVDGLGEMHETFTNKENVKVDGADGEFPFGENE